MAEQAVEQVAQSDQKPTLGWRIRRFFAIRMILTTVLLGVVSVSGFFGYWHWVADIFSSFVPLYALLAGLLVVSLTVLGRGFWALSAVLILSLQVVLLKPYVLPPVGIVHGSANGESLRILQFNVHKDNPNPEQVMAWIEPRIKELDIIVMLEVSESWRAPLARLQERYPYHLEQFEEGNFGIAVFSRLPASKLKLQEFGDMGLPSIVLEGLSSQQQIPFALVATHPLPPLNRIMSQSRNQQLEAVAREAALWRVDHRIVLGDLNITPWSFWFWKFSLDARLRDAQWGLGYVGTFLGWRSGADVPSWVGIPLDHTLISGSFVVVSRTVGPYLGSDHRPVITILDFI